MPLTATHETVRQQFKQFGNVAYVSLPKYRTSGRIKEFGFVEFEEKSSVAKCINAFRQFDAVIGDSQEPENLKSVVAYMKEQDELEKEGEGGEKLKTETNEGDTGKETAEATNTEETKTTGNEESCAAVEKAEPIKKEKRKSKIKTEVETKGEKIKEEKPSDAASSDKNTNKRENEESLGTIENPPAKRLKTQISEDQQDQDDQGNTTDDKASVTDENQDQKTQK